MDSPFPPEMRYAMEVHTQQVMQAFDHGATTILNSLINSIRASSQSTFSREEILELLEYASTKIGGLETDDSLSILPTD